MTADPEGTAPLARIRMRKWGDLPHWEFTSVPLGEDEFGRWYGTPVGTLFTKPGSSHRSEVPHVVLIPRRRLLGTLGAGADWVATFYTDGAGVHTYVDITTPTVLVGSDAITTDLDLDVIREWDGTVRVDDEDEFALHQVELRYPADLVADALTVCESVRAAVAAEHGPFGGVSEAWLATQTR